MNKNFVYIKGRILFLMFLIAFLLISTNKVDVAAASPATHFYVDPPEVRDVSSGSTFLINVSVAEAPDSYAWAIYLSWDPDLLELVQLWDPYWEVTVDVMEGDFLDRRYWDDVWEEWVKTYETTFLSSPSLAEANVEGEIMVGCSLKGDVPWASGDGWLCTLKFSVKAEGASVLNLFDTWLNDHMLAGSPASTYHPNLDGFFYNEPFHDIAITSVTASLTAEIVAINVTVKNEGNYTETSATFTVTVYADKNAYNYTRDPLGRVIKTTIDVGNEVVVGTQTVTEDLAKGATTTLTFTWGTTGVAIGNYTISAEAMGDDDTRDNLFIDGTVTVALAGRDIAITNVVPSPTEVTVGKNVTIEVTVENEGYFNETFDVAVYYDGTLIDTETDVFLASGSSTTLTFTWDTTDVAEGTYTIKAEASEVPDETDTDDNTYPDGTVKVRGAAAPDILLYVAVVIVIIVAAAIAIYFIKIRK